MKTRIYFLDNLRTVLIFLVVVLHSGLVYESVLENQWIVVDPVKNNSIGLIRMYLDLFIMFILFFISGYFIPLSVMKKNTTEFLKSKIKRIMIPWFVGVLTLIPAYKAIFLYSRGLRQEEWYSYFHFFQRVGTDWSFFANHPTQNWLWFLPVLFMFQVIYMVLAKSRVLSFRISIKTAVIITFLLGLAYGVMISTTHLTGWYHSPILHFQRERLLVYFMAFLLGSLCYTLGVFESDKKNKKVYILANVTLTFTLSIFTVVALNFFFNIIEPGRNYYFVSEFIDRIAYYSSAVLSMLSFLYIFIHVFRFNFNKTNGIMRQLNRSSYAVYIIHLIVLGLIALVLVDLPIPAMIKFLILTILTFIISNLLIYAYQRTIQHNFILKVLVAAIFVIGFFTMTYSGNGENTIEKENQSMASQSVEQTPQKSLHEAVIDGNLEVVRQYIHAGADLDVKEPAGGSSPLITAAVFGKTEIAITLIEAGADVNFKNNEGSTPLHSAAFFCHIEIVRSLLSHGADKTLRNNSGSTALESVLIPFEFVQGYYDYFSTTLGPLGLELDYEQIKMARPKIAQLLQEKECLGEAEESRSLKRD